MNDPDEPNEHDQSAEVDGDWDDTLADGPAPTAVPASVRPWLAEQRFLHGLLRTLHTADSAAHEGRIHAILDRIDRDAAPAPRGRWLLVAAAALLLSLFGTWVALPARLPTAEAAMQRAVVELARDVDRRYRLVVSASLGSGASVAHHEFSLVTRPGMHIRVDGKLAFGGLQFGQIRVGCDGSELWMMSMNGSFRRAVPLAERERLVQGLGEVLDVGYLDVHELVRKLPEDFELSVVSRDVDAAGRSQLHLTATRQHDTARLRLRTAQLDCDEESGMITRLVVEAETPFGGMRRLELQYLSEEPAGLVDYRRPW